MSLLDLVGRVDIILLILFLFYLGPLYQASHFFGTTHLVQYKHRWKPQSNQGK